MRRGKKNGGERKKETRRYRDDEQRGKEREGLEGKRWKKEKEGKKNMK